MIGFNLYLVQLDQHPETGDAWEGEPIFLHLSYGTAIEAEHARRVLQSLYGSTARVEVDIKAHYGTHVPGEGA